MDDENFLALVTEVYQEFLAKGLEFPDDELWEIAKKTAETRLQVNEAVNISRRDGKGYGQVLYEQRMKREKLKIT